MTMIDLNVSLIYNIIVTNGMDLETWIIETFKIQQSKPAISVSSLNGNKSATKKKTTSKTTHYKKQYIYYNYYSNKNKY